MYKGRARTGVPRQAMPKDPCFHLRRERPTRRKHMPMLEVDEQLATWQDLNEIPWTGMLVGNGASCAIWKPFRYKSLYHESCSDAHPNPLGPEAVNVFQKLETSNFELVLSA